MFHHVRQSGTIPNGTDFRSQSEPTPNHTFVKLLKGGFLTVALIRNAPDVPEQFISVKLIRFALSLYPVVFIVYGHYPAKFMTEHSLSNMRLDIHLGQPCNKRSSEIMCSPVTYIHPSPYSIYESVGCSDADRFVYVFSREKNIIVRCHGLFEKRLNLFEDWTADNITHLAMLFRYGPYVVQQVKFCLCCQPKL